MPTISDVARSAGVSPATVSRVIQGASNVHPATRDRVQRAIAELGYVPSAVAQSLRSKRTRTLAMMVSDINNSFWTTLVRGVEDVAQRHDYSVLLCNTDEDLAKQLRYLDLLISQQVDGVIIAPYDSDARHLDKLRQRNIPTVIVDRRIEGWDVDSVYSDSVSGARVLVQHLIRLGHRRIAAISGPATTSTAEDRIAGYCMALAEAGIPVDPRLIRRGEYRIASGEEQTLQLLDEGLEPTAIFAANNLLAMGAIDALEKRGLRIPLDVALVCFDDLPIASHLFPFLTVVVQPVYDMGVNAAQLLLSRLESQVDLQPRHVILPVRLIVRHSCGSQRLADGGFPLSLPIPKNGLKPSVMVGVLSPEERQRISNCSSAVRLAAPSASGRLTARDKPDAQRLLRVLQHQEADRVPHLELHVASRAAYEYVLEREPQGDEVTARLGGMPIAPEDQVDFALRLGLDAVLCALAWRREGALSPDLARPPSLADQLSLLERYLRAAQGTGVGVAARFASFVDLAQEAAGIGPLWRLSPEGRKHVEQRLDLILEGQEHAMRVVCDRFAHDLTLIVVQGPDWDKLVFDADAFLELYLPRLQRLIAPALEHGKPLLMQGRGQSDRLLPLLHDLGFSAVHLAGCSLDQLQEIRAKWGCRLALVGGFPTSLLARGSQSEIEDRVCEYLVKLAPNGGYVFGSSDGIPEDVPPQNLVAMSRALHRFGRYESLGGEQWTLERR